MTQSQLQNALSWTDFSTQSPSWLLFNKSTPERKRQSLTSLESKQMSLRSSIGRLIFHHAKKVLMSLVSKLKEPDGMLLLDNLKSPDQRNNSLLSQLSTAEPTKSQQRSRLIKVFINAQSTRQKTEETPTCSQPSSRPNSQPKNGFLLVSPWFLMLKVSLTLSHQEKKFHSSERNSDE